MSNRNAYLQLLIYGGLAFFLSSCVAPMANIVNDNTFTFESIKSSNMVFGGLAPNVKSMDEHYFIKHTEIAYQALMNQRENISLKNNQHLVNELGKEKLLEITYKLTEKENKNSELLQQLSKTLPDSRYIIFSRIVYDNISKERNSATQASNPLVSGYNYTTLRKVTVITVIYDLKYYKKSWSGVINTTDSNNKFVPHTHDSNFLKDLLNEIVEDAISIYPTAPTLERAIENSFSGIADNFPDQTCRESGLKNCIKRAFKRTISILSQ